MRLVDAGESVGSKFVGVDHTKYRHLCAGNKLLSLGKEFLEGEGGRVGGRTEAAGFDHEVGHGEGVDSVVER
jgi:hypothetical protein